MSRQSDVLRGLYVASSRADSREGSKHSWYVSLLKRIETRRTVFSVDQMKFFLALADTELVFVG